MAADADTTLVQMPAVVEPEDYITEEEIRTYSLHSGIKFECKLPAEHFISRFMEYGADISDAYPDYWFGSGLFALAVVADKKIKMSLNKAHSLQISMYSLMVSPVCRGKAR